LRIDEQNIEFIKKKINGRKVVLYGTGDNSKVCVENLTDSNIKFDFFTRTGIIWGG
jgi:hypothetical protein